MLPCPECRTRSNVLDSRLVRGAVKRRRECPKCGRRWTTHETADASMQIASLDKTVARGLHSVERRQKHLEAEVVDLIDHLRSNAGMRQRGA